MNKLRLYTLDVNYGAELAKADDKVMSVSPQQDKENRPFVGIVIVCQDKKYCIPMTSPKPKHQKMKNQKDFLKMITKKGKLVGALNFNNMIPVDDRLIKMININPSADDSKAERDYKFLLRDELTWCNKNKEKISNQANTLYRLVTQQSEDNIKLVQRCCNFKELETALNKYLIDNGFEKPEKEYIIKEISEEQFNALKNSKIPFKTAVKDGQRAIKFEAELNEKINSILNANMNKNVL